jgi:hypothetical protein
MAQNDCLCKLGIVIMNTIKLNLELAKAVEFQRPVASSRVVKQKATNESKSVEMPPQPRTPAWAWGFSPMLPWGTLKEGL